MADFGIGEYLLAEAAGDAAIADMVGLPVADLIGVGALEAGAGAGALTAAEAASAAGAAEAGTALTAADLVASGAAPDIGSTVASGAFDGAQGIDALGQRVVDPATQAINAGNAANVTGDPYMQKVGFEGTNPFQAPTEFNDFQDPSKLAQGSSRGIDQLQVGQNVGQGVSQSVMDTQKLAEMGVKPIGIAPVGAAPGTILPNGSIVGNNGMVYNQMQAAQGLSGTLETSGPISRALAGSTMGIPNKYLAMAGTSAVAGPLIKKALTPDPRYGINPQASEPYSGPLSKFNYNPATYTPAPSPAPNYYTPQYKRYAAGGTTKSDSMSDLMGSGDSMEQYLSDYQSDPASVYQKAKDGDYNAMLALNKIRKTPNENYAAGGIAQLAVGGKLLRGRGDGMSDSIKANISGKREARLADGEFVVPADVVSHLGNGSTDAGAKQLYSMMDKVRNARTGRKAQGRQITPQKYMPA
jgi:hypothetical protein